jgi:mannose-6-phosphate isomerase-like protein (cupin superfamily)
MATTITTKIPLVADRPDSFRIEQQTVDNENFRQVVWTGRNLQVVLMSLKPYEMIDREVHVGSDQFFRVEQGSINIMVEHIDDETRRINNVMLTARSGDAIVVPAGTYHTVMADANVGAKIYTIYGPPQHRKLLVQETKRSHGDDDE